MLPTITIGIRQITILNVSGFDINWKRVIKNLREYSGLKMNQISAFCGISHTRTMKASAGESVNFSDCEKLALLDLHQDNCEKLHDISILNIRG